jgi:MscS family membrane protein
MRVRWSLSFFWTLVAVSGVLCTNTASANQIPGLTATAPTTSPTTSVTTPPDPLGRETPRGTVFGFIKAAQEERYPVAIEYFQPSAKHKRISLEEEEQLVTQLLAILNQKSAGPLEFLSRDPEGRLDDGLPPDQEKISSTLGATDKFPVYLIRQEDEHGHKLWYFSWNTLGKVPEMYEALVFPEIEKDIPPVLVRNRLLSMPLWQWIAMIVFIPVALLIGRILTLIGWYFVGRWRKARGMELLEKEPFFKLEPVTLAMAILLHYWFVSYIGTSLLYRLYYRRIIWIFLAFAFYWILTRITRAITTRIGRSLTSRGMFAERSIVSLVRRFTEVTIFMFVTLFALRILGLDISTALAGVGIGGIALGLGAQKTFENLFGGISILFDKVVLIGDTCKINNQLGVVEDIGLRSTRLRTNDRTLLSIPNGTMATSTIENLRTRDKFLCQQTIRLRYDLSPDHLRYVLAELQNVLKDNPKVEESTARARFSKFAEYALEVEIFCYILERDGNEFLALQEALLLQLMESLDKAGAVVALPTQTTFVNQDSWIDPQKEKAAEAAIAKVRDPGVPGPQGTLSGETKLPSP